MDLVEAIYRATKMFPKSEEFALKSQMQRSAIFIPSNIAEGSGRGSNRDQSQFLRVALGSLRELDTQTEIAKRLSYINPPLEEELRKSILSIEYLLKRLIASLDK